MFPVSISPESAHGGCVDAAITFSFWALGLMIAAGLALAIHIW